MDLTTVSKRLNSTNSGGGGGGKDKPYTNLQDAIDDVILIFRNCMTYNADGSVFYLLAEDFLKKFEEKANKLVADGSGLKRKESSSTSVSVSGTPLLPSSSDQAPAVTTRQAFARNLFRIGKEELGRVITILDDRSPDSLTKNAAEDEVEVNVDSIENRVFHELDLYVNQVIGGDKKKKTAEAGKKK